MAGGHLRSLSLRGHMLQWERQAVKSDRPVSSLSWLSHHKMLHEGRSRPQEVETEQTTCLYHGGDAINGSDCDQKTDAETVTNTLKLEPHLPEKLVTKKQHVAFIRGYDFLIIVINVFGVSPTFDSCFSPPGLPPISETPGGRDTHVAGHP